MVMMMMMMMMTNMYRMLTLFFFICVLLQDGCGLPLSGRSELPAHAPHPHRVRTKRCSCNSWEDKECIYFCHLDVIWVNTPCKLLPYGLGNVASRRRRRSTNRCECANPTDKTCSSFCHNSSENPRIVVVAPSVTSSSPSNAGGNKLLAYLRSVVKSNMAAAQEILLPKEKPSPVRLKSRKSR